MKEKDTSAYVDDLWKRIGRKLKSRGVRPKDIGRAIKLARKSGCEIPFSYQGGIKCRKL